MSNWNYSGNPGSSAKDEVRFLIGDTDSRDPLINDDEIRYLLTKNSGSVTAAAIKAAEQIYAQFSRLCDETVGRVSMSYSQKAKGMRALIDQLKERNAIDNCIPYAGGISVGDKAVQEGDGDRVKPAFSSEMMENDSAATRPIESNDG